MFYKKKELVILLLLIVSICAISFVSATGDVADSVTMDGSSDMVMSDDGAVALDESNVGDIYETTENEVVAIDENDEVLASEDEHIVSQDQSSDVVAGLPVYSNQYTITIKDGNQISATNGGNFYYYLNPYYMYYTDNYNFKFVVYDRNGMIYETQYYQDDSGSLAAGNYYITFGKNLFKPGLYVIGAINKADNTVMSANTLKVSGNAVITANNFNGVYNTGTMTARVTDTKGNPLTMMNVNVEFANGKTKITKTYSTDGNGYISFTPPVNAGTWTVTFSSGLDFVTATSVVRTAIITKAPVSIKAYKVTEYKGFKTTLKAKVTSNGKNVNEGTVTFKINGKTYKAAVKNGIATVKVKLSKTKTYKYTATYNGNANLKDSKKVKDKAVLKKRLKTKIICKNYSIYSFNQKVITLKVKTSSGKNVKDGKLKIRANGQTSYATVKNGKAKVLLYGLGMKHFKGMSGNTETYKKVIHKVVKLKYIPTSHKYKSSSKRVKATSKFKCPGCGKTTTHKHYAVGYFYTHVNIVRVV